MLISPEGTKSFYFRYAWHGKRFEIKIGKYPLTPLVGARKKRDDYLLMVENGKNPKYKSNNSKLFRDIALDWLQIQDDLSDKTIVTTAQRLNRCIEEFGYIPISEIDSIQMLTFLQKIENRGYIETAKRTKSIISRVYEYANILNLTNINPTTGLSRILKNKKSNNFPFVKKIEDMRHLMFDISNYQGMIEVQFALKIAAYTFVRPSELRFSRWNELEGDIWRMPAERTKLKRERLVPLSTQVKTLISSSTCPLNRFLESLKSDLRCPIIGSIAARLLHSLRFFVSLITIVSLKGFFRQGDVCAPSTTFVPI
ncbi:hypothetical protein [uncultured Gammaproteobacteria bacterium]|nr:integrase arm-type DNA-binding domain-containing protein [thiotrophic endosymbiont of Bathymodiolus puteoserpentis (Logatchev)]CAC9659121.1 hypothetical protein [uncultured Gammaproteobacteria bacterium]CAC9954682.1 hypothetical protein [uncultured Gammaproteobacteria bacterium]SSC09565.1 hypothetical protein BPUTEOSOX_319 [thiotrophic endosymbiont of Bathymodiolus puteoserpentis (Logatchev)]